MGKGIDLQTQDGSTLTIGITRAMWNSELTDELTQHCENAIKKCGAKVIILDVPGAYETVFGAKVLIDKEKLDAVVCIAVLIKGETMHFEYISEAVTHGIMDLSLTTGVPIIYGILNVLTEEQAKARVSHATEWGLSAVHMALQNHQ